MRLTLFVLGTEQSKSFPFEFSAVEMDQESYNGMNVRLRYLLKASVLKQYAMNVTKEKEFWVSSAAAIHVLIALDVDSWPAH